MTTTLTAALVEDPHECEPHMLCPSGYNDWHNWARRMGKTHVQRKCKGCGLFEIWEPKPVAVPERRRKGGR